jgi:hypothetical protein
VSPEDLGGPAEILVQEGRIAAIGRTIDLSERSPRLT